MDFSFLSPFISQYASQHPWIVNVLVGIGIARLVFKPIFAAFQRHLEVYLPDPEKQKKLTAMINSKPWKVIAFIADYALSVKLPVTPGSLPARVQAAIEADKKAEAEADKPKPAAGL